MDRFLNVLLLIGIWIATIATVIFFIVLTLPIFIPLVTFLVSFSATCFYCIYHLAVEFVWVRIFIIVYLFFRVVRWMLDR